MTDNQLVGTWKLKSYEIRASNGSVSYPMGKEPVGYAAFTHEGYFFPVIMNAERPGFKSPDLRLSSTDERAAAASTYMSYVGPFEVDGDRFRTKVEASLFPNWVGSVQERNYRVEGKTLLISTVTRIPGGEELAQYLAWERI